MREWGGKVTYADENGLTLERSLILCKFITEFLNTQGWENIGKRVYLPMKLSLIITYRIRNEFPVQYVWRKEQQARVLQIRQDHFQDKLIRLHSSVL